MKTGAFSGPAGVVHTSADRGGLVSRVDGLLDAAEAVIVRDGIASLALDAVAAEAKVSKGGLLHHFPSKDRLVEALVRRTAASLDAHYEQAYRRVPEGPGRMARGLLASNLADMQDWCTACQRSSTAAFTALAHNPALIEPLRAAYAGLHRRLDGDELPSGIGEVVVAAIDGLWLYWVLGLVPVDQKMIVRVRKALQQILDDANPKRKVGEPKRRGARARPAAKRSTKAKRGR